MKLLATLLIAASVAFAVRVHAAPIDYDQAKATPWLNQSADPVWTPREELLFQVVSGADVATTCASGRIPGVVEEGTLPVALFGHHPSCAQDLEFGIGRGALHLLGTKLMQRFGAPNWLVVMWQAGTTSAEAAAVAGNSDILAGGRGF